MKEKLDPLICERFREAINDSPTIGEEKEFSTLYNLSCAVMDRIDSSVRYLNDHWDYPNSEDDFLCFIMFSCILNDGVGSIYRATIGTDPSCNAEKKHFKEFCMGDPCYLSEEECPTDEEFFEYFRSLVFAHPYETSRNKTFKRILGTQVSPWVVVNKQMLPFYRYPEAIGVRTYTSIMKDESDTHDIMFSFCALKNFLTEKYFALNDVTYWIKEESEITFREWKKIKVNRDLAGTELLRDICRILDMRHESTYGIETMIRNLEIPISDKRNEDVVNQYREYLKNLIPDLCNQIDSLNSEGQYEIEAKIKGFMPSGLHRMAHYQLEKIFSYLGEKHSYIARGSDEEWGLKQAEAFYNEFANRWVFMDVYKTEYDEIKLLVTVSLFMECEKQKKA